MKVCNLNRAAFYQILSAVFDFIKLKPTIIELGVLRGQNAEVMHKILNPEKMYLIDTWNAEVSKLAFVPFDELPPWLNPPEAHDNYYGGPVNQQETFDNIYKDCLARFAQYGNVHVIKQDTAEAFREFSKDKKKFNITYIDANHQYEWVLRDLMYWCNLVDDNGVIIMNDCCFSQNGAKQNLGVLEATSSFIKRTDFVPVLLTNTDWSDVVLARKGSKMEAVIDMVTKSSDASWVEIPYQLLGNAKIIYGSQKTNISFS